MPISGLISVLISGAFDKGLYALDLVYDERYARLATGSAMMLLAVRLAIKGGFEFLDATQLARLLPFPTGSGRAPDAAAAVPSTPAAAVPSGALR